ncbi:MAG: asparaginase [Rhodocyclaceae bacterium]|jgi:L-asparaginase|nr:asparaginase [Rhodocyclaceae bacterium]MCA3082137.1 asparaginase [Rhodocyclaceae bacterium]
MKIAVLITGGTFDKEYNELNGELFFKKTHVPEMLNMGRSLVKTRVDTLMMKDSLLMTDDDRAIIATACMKARESALVITHGTDTMEDTARYLAPRVKGKTVILTGAMVPYKFGSSDGLFNLGSALAYAQVLTCGVYVAMNGQCFAWDNVRKNKKKGVFEARRTVKQ